MAAAAVPEGFLSPDRKKSIQYLSDEYDDLLFSKTKIMDEMRIVLTRLDGIEKMYRIMYGVFIYTDGMLLRVLSVSKVEVEVFY